MQTGLAASLVMDVHFELTLSHDYRTGGSSFFTNRTESSEKATVPCGPGQTKRVKLIVM